MTAMDNERISYYYSKYRNRIGGFAFAVLKKKGGGSIYGTWKDIVQDAFISLKDCEDINAAAVLGYLFLKVRRDCSNLLKIDERHRRHHEQISYLSDEFYWDAQMTRSGVYSEIFAEVNAAIDKLPIGERIVFKMRYIDGMKPKEICKLLNIKSGTFDTNIMRVKHKLRKQFKGREIY